MTRKDPRRAWYVAVEGIDGAGKSTVVRRIAGRLRRAGVRVIVRREPASRELGRQAQLASVNDPWTGGVYFTLDRYLARTDLEGDLRRAAVVITDRSFWSTLAYQGSALPPRSRATLAELQREATVPPDQVLFVDLDPEDAMRRVRARTSMRGPLEQRRTLERVARAYRRFARENRWVVLDARSTIAEVVEEACRSIQAQLSDRARPRPRRRS